MRPTGIVKFVDLSAPCFDETGHNGLSTALIGLKRALRKGTEPNWTPLNVRGFVPNKNVLAPSRSVAAVDVYSAMNGAPRPRQRAQHARSRWNPAWPAGRNCVALKTMEGESHCRIARPGTTVDLGNACRVVGCRGQRLAPTLWKERDRLRAAVFFCQWLSRVLLTRCHHDCCATGAAVYGGGIVSVSRRERFVESDGCAYSYSALRAEPNTRSTDMPRCHLR